MLDVYKQMSDYRNRLSTEFYDANRKLEEKKEKLYVS